MELKNCRFVKTYLSYIKFSSYLFSPQQKKKGYDKVQKQLQIIIAFVIV